MGTWGRTKGPKAARNRKEKHVVIASIGIFRNASGAIEYDRNKTDMTVKGPYFGRDRREVG